MARASGLSLRRLVAALLATAAAACAPPGAADPGELVASERAFARAAAARGMREAFLEFLADDAVLFRPGPVDGRRWFLDRPAPPGLLRWEPIAAQVSLAGDLGYTTGPWEYVRDDGQEPARAWGHYASVWRRGPDGAWRVAIDIGTGHAEPPAELWRSRLADAPATAAAAPPTGRAPAPAPLLAADRRLAERVASAGWVAAYREVASPEIRLQREGQLPRLGTDALAELAPADGSPPAFRPLAGELARSEDLGYTYGLVEDPSRPGQPRGSYLRVWLREPAAGWRIALDVQVAH